VISYQSEKYALVNSRAIEHRRHLGRVRRFLDPQPHERLLEVGCSRGYLTRLVQELAPHTHGVDLNAKAIARGVTSGLTVMDAQQLAFRDESFDKMFSFHCIEHVPDLGAALREMDRVLKPGGLLLLVYPAEPIRGLYVVPTAWMVFRSLWRARELHLHRLSPRRLRPFLAATSLNALESKFEFFLMPQFITLLRKVATPLTRRSRSSDRTTSHEAERSAVPEGPPRTVGAAPAVRIG
jgi:ubiquinone/menaquinone biosynthesis C-methylase UbiE